MKKALALVLILILATVPAFAEDTFLSDFNAYAEGLYGISKITAVQAGKLYKSDVVEMIVTSQGAEIYGENPLDVISAACCTLRVIDNSGNMLDQYGRVMHAYFLNNVRGKETRATTDSGILVFYSENNGICSVRLVK
jgi:hypothetical protein